MKAPLRPRGSTSESAPVETPEDTTRLGGASVGTELIHKMK
eukprot:CAMPEP_0176410216 /NCGR_PEP_ID=MMETSP0127-20121128/2937_1 /TAXON_ID=938130 /ORGANISM="Platyophrya macrostoma, Strain WH" /LENGTH=40 /DNA_ID= /DNA_START= /DNA_END= /DNA_ORIENTATION=